MKTQTVILILATLSTGLMAELFFTWSNTVTTGIGRLGDLEYLRAFQSMNRTILNPAFFLVFFGAAVLLPISCYMQYKLSPDHFFWMLLAACLHYLIGAIVVTFAGNIPLNSILEGSKLDGMSLEDVKTLRENFENRWNMLNWIRTYCSLGAFLILIFVCVKTGS